ncbi:MAG: hypothetical protein IBX68_10260 [Dehalococcoidia bacterium]|nr:hypothetical protein [Dehalococcoidia bacterium]
MLWEETADLKSKLDVDVKCYSGHSYAERPLSFTLGGREYAIKAIEKEWREPGEKHFRVVIITDLSLELCYYEESGRWSLLNAPETLEG